MTYEALYIKVLKYSASPSFLPTPQHTASEQSAPRAAPGGSIAAAVRARESR